jgi:hypothetical protein
MNFFIFERRNDMEANREIACTIVKVFEILLDRKGISIPCQSELEETERSLENNMAKIYGSEYWDLVNGIEFILNMRDFESKNEEGEKHVQNKYI